jgi:8-oxo-dGTP pyrophosphatase MutT (NUDIX family)
MSIIREAREEVGISISPADLKPVGTMFRRSLEPRVDFFFAASRWNGILRICEPHKCTELIWADAHHLPPGTLDYIQQAITGMYEGRYFSEPGWITSSP